MTCLSKESLKRPLRSVRKALEQVGRSSSYLWTDNKLWSGYSYTIPKEEQIRSALYAALSKELVVETEWTLYEPGPRQGQVRACGEIDLVGFTLQGEAKAGVTPPVLLLEVKRAWHIAGWNNKPQEMARAIERDVERLREIKKKLGDKDKSVAGVLVASFRDDEKANPLCKVENRECLLDWANLYEWQVDDERRVAISMRFDWIPA